MTTILLAAMAFVALAQTSNPTLIGWAKLPAETAADGPKSGQFTQSANGITAPFARQPVQGFSSLRAEKNGRFTVLCDNGYGTKKNSADFVLRLYTVRPDFKKKTVAVEGKPITLHDPDRKIGFPIVADAATYPDSTIAVDASIRRERLLTGADLDIESFVRAPDDGTLWFGDEFGPFLVHTDARGKLLEAPIPLPGVQSPDNPRATQATPNLPSSGGFEGLAIAPDGKTLYALLEKSLTDDPDPTRLWINVFDRAAKRFTGTRLAYKKDAPGHSIGEMTAINDHQFLIIERDNEQGAAARFKRIFRVDIAKVDAAGFVEKTPLVDLLAIDDPNRLGGQASATFTFPFITIESVAIVDDRTLLVANDNNFPGSAGRTPNRPDDDEFALIRLPAPLNRR